jgi:hypothetical protein
MFRHPAFLLIQPNPETGKDKILNNKQIPFFKIFKFQTKYNVLNTICNLGCYFCDLFVI